MSLEKDVCYVLTVEHFSGSLTEVLGVYTDLEEAKKVQRSYDSLTRISVTIYRVPLHAAPKPRSAKDVQKAKPGRGPKKKGDGDASKEK